MRILMLTQWFTPEPDFKGLPFAKELVRRGHNVQVLTGFPNYPGGKLYPGYKVRPVQFESIEGVSVIRAPLYPSHDNSSVRRVLNYVSFSLSATILALILAWRVDVVYAYHAPATIALPAIVLRLFKRMPFVYDINDIWPDSLSASRMLNNNLLLKCVDLWCKFTYRMASRIVVVAPGFKEKLKERGVPASKVEVIYNWCNEVQQEADIDVTIANKIGFAGKFNIVFAGTMGKVQALDAVIDAAKIIAIRQPAVQFVFIGGGIEVNRLMNRVASEQVDNCLFVPRQPVSAIGPILKISDVLLVHLQDIPLFEITIPSKTTAYMAVGRPILMAVRGDAAKLVEMSNSGIVCTPEDPLSIAEAVDVFFNMSQSERDFMGACGKKYYDEKLSLPVGVKKFEDIFKSLT